MAEANRENHLSHLSALRVRLATDPQQISDSFTQTVRGSGEHQSSFSAVDLNYTVPDLAGHAVYIDSSGRQQNQAKEPMVTTLGIELPRTQSPSTERSSSKTELFWKSTSFASLRFGKYSTMVFFQRSDGWIQCGLIPDWEDDEEDETKEEEWEDQKSQENQETQEDEVREERAQDKDYEECVQDEDYKGLILLEPIALASLGSPLAAGFLERKVIGLVYIAEKNGKQIVCEHRLKFYRHGGSTIPWFPSKLETLEILAATPTKIFLFENKSKQYLCFEEASGNLIYLQYDDSNEEWTWTSGPQPPSNLLYHCPLGIQIKEKSVQESDERTGSFVHYFYYQYPAAESENEYSMTQIMISIWQDGENQLATTDPR
jgi:hypothetical protein